MVSIAQRMAKLRTVRLELSPNIRRSESILTSSLHYREFNTPRSPSGRDSLVLTTPQLLSIRIGPGAAILPRDVSRIHMDFAPKFNDGHLGPRYSPHSPRSSIRQFVPTKPNTPSD